MLLKFNLSPDIKLLMCSYLLLEEILIIFRDDIATRDKIIKLYFKKLPSINDASKNGNLETVKYLYGKEIQPTNYTIYYASWKGHLEVVKYLFEKGIVPTHDAMDKASVNGHLEVVKYLYEKGIRPTDYGINWAGIKEHLEVVKYLKSKMIY